MGHAEPSPVRRCHKICIRCGNKNSAYVPQHSVHCRSASEINCYICRYFEHLLITLFVLIISYFILKFQNILPFLSSFSRLPTAASRSWSLKRPASIMRYETDCNLYHITGPLPFFSLSIPVPLPQGSLTWFREG